MKEKRIALKQKSKLIIAQSRGKVSLVSISFVALTVVLSVLVSGLSGATQYMQTYNDAYYDAYEDITELYQQSDGQTDMEEVSEAAYGELEKAMQKVSVWPDVKPIALVLCAAILLLHSLLRAGFVNYCLLISRREEANFKDLFDGFYYTGRLVLMNLLRGFGVAIGLAVLVFPGIMLLYRWRLAVYVAFDQPELSAVGCLKRSAELTKSLRSELFALDLSFAGWWIIGKIIQNLIIYPVTDVFAMPFWGLTVSQWYNEKTGYLKMPEGSDDACSSAPQN